MYRYGAKRFDPGSGTYDMGFRDYAPGLNRFTSRDSYNGALEDLNLGTDPFTSNRYAFTAGNPITNIELDGHIDVDPESSGSTHEYATGQHTYHPGGSQPDGKPSDPTVRHQIGVRVVIAPDIDTYHSARAAVEQQFRDNGWTLDGLDCGSDPHQKTTLNGAEMNCVGAIQMNATEFAKRMCEQPGMQCGNQGNDFAKLMEAGAAVGLFGKDGGSNGRIGGVRGESPLRLNRHGQLTNGTYTLDAEGMRPHMRGSFSDQKSQFLSSVDADRAVLDAAVYADANGLWKGNKAKVYVTNGPVGALGDTGELTSWINVYRTNTGFIHGAPGRAS